MLKSYVLGDATPVQVVYVTDISRIKALHLAFFTNFVTTRGKMTPSRVALFLCMPCPLVNLAGTLAASFYYA